MDTKQKSFAIQCLRRGSMRWKAKNEAFKKARVARGLYKCATCELVYTRKNVQVDHVVPCVPTDGWDGFDGFIERLLCDESGFQCLCKDCHLVKSTFENMTRKENRRKK